MKLKQLFTALFLVLTINSAHSQSPKLENSILWKISGNGLTQDSYLFGTVHLIPKADYFFTKKMEKAFNSCKTLALEVDMNMSLKEQIELAKRAMLPAGKTLSDYMTKEEFNHFKAYMLDSLNIKEKKYKAMLKMQPFFSSGLMIQDLVKKPKMYEKEFMKKAKKNKMNLVGLETIDYQMSVIENISIEEQVKMTYTSDLSGNPLEEYYQLIEAYKNQDLELLHDYMNDEAMGEDINYALLTQRNLNWIPVIEKLVKNQATFIAVGAGHLPGETGVINLLRKAGYTVEAVK